MSWKEKLASKNSSAVSNQNQQQPNYQQQSQHPSVTPGQVTQGHVTQGHVTQGHVTQGQGWKQRLATNIGHDIPQNNSQYIALPKIDIADMNAFPTLGNSAVPTPVEKKILTGFVDLAKEWKKHDKEQADRDEIERIQREQQEFSYNFNAKKMNLINSSLMTYSMMNSPYKPRSDIDEVPYHDNYDSTQDGYLHEDQV